MKRLFKGLFVLLLSAFLFIPVRAVQENVRDDYGMITSSEEMILNEMAGTISKDHGYGIYIRVFSRTDDFMTIEDFAEKVWQEEDLGYGPDKEGIMLILTMEDRSFDIFERHGPIGDAAFSAYAREQIADDVVHNYLSNDYYYEGFKQFISLCDTYLNYYEEGDPITEYHDPIREQREAEEKARRAAAERGMKTGVNCAVPPIVSLLTCLGLKSRNKTERIATKANDYIPKDGILITRHTDQFLYENRTVTHVERDRGGGGGGFSSSSSSFGGHTSGHF
ncbi:MAG: TPM domain-containing protein [Solobacterium sp.]|nr:TPM domain-containing protein [Solobacterium sp.]